MFEHDQEAVNALLNENRNFRRLYDKHGQLKRAVEEAHEGHVNGEGVSLEELKRRKLDLKDQMAAIIADYKHNQPRAPSKQG